MTPRGWVLAPGSVNRRFVAIATAKRSVINNRVSVRLRAFASRPFERGAAERRRATGEKSAGIHRSSLIILAFTRPAATSARPVPLLLSLPPLPRLSFSLLSSLSFSFIFPCKYRLRGVNGETESERGTAAPVEQGHHCRPVSTFSRDKTILHFLRPTTFLFRAMLRPA